jgi:hypothetical protein
MKPDFHYIICEQSGRWAAALRVLLERERRAQRTSLARSHGTRMRIHELRTFDEFRLALAANRPAIGLIEVSAANLADVLERFAAESRRNVRYIILVDTDLGPQSQAERQAIADAVLEVGALAALDSPRQIRTVLEIAERLAANQAADSDELVFALPW